MFQKNRLLGMVAVLGVAVTGTACSPGFILSWVPTQLNQPTPTPSPVQDQTPSFTLNLFVYDPNTGMSGLRLKSIDGKVNLNLSQDGSGNQFTQCYLGFGNGVTSSAPRVSPDGRFSVFLTDCAEIVGQSSAWDTPQVVLYDRKTATFELISQNAAHQESDDGSYDPTVSNDGRYVVFSSASTNLISGVSTGRSEIYLKDRELGTLTRVSIGLAGANPNQPSTRPVISGNGQFIAFNSGASNYVAGDTNNNFDIFLYEVASQTITRISKPSAGEANGRSVEPSISYDGSKIAFTSSATNLVSSDTNGVRDIFVYDRSNQTFTRVSTDDNGVEGDAYSGGGSISQDGKTVAFTSESTNLVANDTNGLIDVFVKNLDTGVVKRLSVHESGAESDGNIGNPVVSADGRYIAFESSDILLTADPDLHSNVYVYDVQEGKLKLMDAGLSNLPANADIFLNYEL